ncbi:hypothetical protein V5E97_06595 [Singulisphaera sp. Ch08]|uniref:Uncharacterized protein n=1 Tax=Singulisphaera sp. Ch08 TaxID=3120278 RepID=A0AAU7CM01_9BACT
MTEIELVKTMIAIKNFFPPDGVEVALVLQPRPGVCRATLLVAVVGSGTPRQLFEITEPPTEEFLSMLYLAAQELWEHSQGRSESTASVLGLDFKLIGGD